MFPELYLFQGARPEENFVLGVDPLRTDARVLARRITPETALAVKEVAEFLAPTHPVEVRNTGAYLDTLGLFSSKAAPADLIRRLVSCLGPKLLENPESAKRLVHPSHVEAADRGPVEPMTLLTLWVIDPEAPGHIRVPVPTNRTWRRIGKLILRPYLKSAPLPKKARPVIDGEPGAPLPLKKAAQRALRAPFLLWAGIEIDGTVYPLAWRCKRPPLPESSIAEWSLPDSQEEKAVR